MIFARFFYPDFLDESISHQVGVAVVRAGSDQEMHHDATVAGRRYEIATHYQLFEGTNFRNCRPISLKHEISR